VRSVSREGVPGAGTRGRSLFVFNRRWIETRCSCGRRLDIPSCEILHQHSVEEDIAAADLAKQDAIGGVIQEPDIIPRS
jgi:hypothetical protein